MTNKIFQEPTNPVAFEMGNDGKIVDVHTKQGASGMVRVIGGVLYDPAGNVIPGGGGGSGFTAWNVTPDGAMDGVNMVYTFTGATIAPGKILLFASGVPMIIKQTPDITGDFTQDGNVFTKNGRALNSAAPDNDTLFGCY